MNGLLAAYKRVKEWVGSDVVGGGGFNMSEWKRDIEVRREELRSRPVFQHLETEHNRTPGDWISDRELDAWHADLHDVGGHEAAQRHGE